MDEKRCLVLLRGEFEVSWDGASHRIGPRADVFLGYPHAVYLPARTPFRIVAPVACEIAEARAASKRELEPRVIRPEDCGCEIRGGGNATRQIVDILPPSFPADRLTTTYQTSIGVQREFVGMVASADFVYAKGMNLATLVSSNQRLPNAAGSNAAGLGTAPYPNFGFVEWRAQNGKSEYKGVDLGLEKRFARGYAFGLSYTLGDSKDNSSEQLTTQGSNAFPQNARDFESWYGPSDYDVRHRFTANFVWELPLGQNVLARGWAVSGIYTKRSGRPFTVNQSNNNVDTNMTGLPNVSGDTKGPETVDQWFNTVNVGLPNRNITDAATFGTISGLSSDPRIMQIVRCTF